MAARMRAGVQRSRGSCAAARDFAPTGTARTLRVLRPQCVSALAPLLYALLLACASVGTATAARMPLSLAPAAAAAAPQAAPPASGLLARARARKAPVLATMPQAQYVAPAATPVAPQLISRVASAVLGVGLISAILAAVYLAAGAANARPGAEAQSYAGYPPRDVAMMAPGERTRLIREMQRAPPR